MAQEDKQERVETWKVILSIFSQEVRPINKPSWTTLHIHNYGTLLITAMFLSLGILRYRNFISQHSPVSWHIRVPKLRHTALDPIFLLVCFLAINIWSMELSLCCCVFKTHLWLGLGRWISAERLSLGLGKEFW